MSKSTSAEPQAPNAYRFSIAWPQYLQDRGGWNERTTVDAFLKLADAMSRKLGDRVKHWITHNEPWCTAIIGNFEGWHAPGLTDFKTALQVSHHVLLSHGRAVPLIRANVPDAQVGRACRSCWRGSRTTTTRGRST